MGVLYKLSFSNGKSYIGLTTRGVVARFKQHEYDAVVKRKDLPLYAAWRKYGAPNVVTLAVLSDADLCLAEIKAIQVFDTLVPNGYNVSYGGSISPMKNQLAAKKLSKVLTGRTLSQTHVTNLILNHKRRRIHELSTGITYASVKDAIEQLKIGKSVIYNSLKSKKPVPRGRHKGFQFIDIDNI